MIQRKEYLDNLIALKDKQVIKVVTGVRRCGKSTLFELYIEHLKQTGVDDSQIISVNLEDLDNANLLDYKALYSHIKDEEELKIAYHKHDLSQPLPCGTCEDVANTALYLASDMSNYLTGQVIMLDGGASIKAYNEGD